MTLIPTSKAYEDYQRHLEQESRMVMLERSNQLLSVQVETQKRQIEELMDWVGKSMQLLEDSYKEIRDLRRDVEAVYNDRKLEDRPKD